MNLNVKDTRAIDHDQIQDKMEQNYLFTLLILGTTDLSM